MAKNNTPERPDLDKKNDDRIITEVSDVTPLNCDEPIVTRWELWSYYLYYNGGSGVPVYATLTVFQDLATLAGYDAVRGPGSSCLGAHASGKCVVPWGSGTSNISSVVLLASGISFAMITIILTVIGPAADYSSLGRWPLLVASVIYWASMFSTMTLTSPSRWRVAMGLYTVGSIAYGVAVAFYAAIFPNLSRNRKHIRELKEQCEQGMITMEEYERAESLEKSRISSISIAHGAIGYVIILILELPILIPLQGNAKVNNYVLMMATAYGVLAGIWWFIFEQPRPGPKLPKGEHYFTIGWKQIWIALKQYKKLPNTFTYLFAYFLLADGLNTTTTLVRICQNSQFTFSFLENAYLGMVQGGTSAISIVAFWYIQRHWKLDSKKMFIATNVVAIILPLWGMIGIWTNKFGYHNRWEFWAYNVAFGFFQAPYFSYSQTVMAELTPPGFDYMFFGLFGLTNRASSIIGPNVIQAIINRTDNTWQGFSFLFAICFASSLMIWFTVDVHKGRRDAERWAVEKRGTAYTTRF